MTDGAAWSVWFLIVTPVLVSMALDAVWLLRIQRGRRRELERRFEEADRDVRLRRLRQRIAVLEAEVNVPLDVLIRAAEEKAEREYRLAYVDRAREDFVYGLNRYSEHGLEHLVKVRFATRPGGEEAW